MKIRLTSRKIVLLILAWSLLVTPACTLSLFNLPNIDLPTQPTEVVIPSPTPLPQAQVTFRVVIPAPLAPNETLAISLLDEVTGLALNPVNYPMQARDLLTYTVTLPLAANSVVKYRYVRMSGGAVQEYTAFQTPIRYRLYYVTGPAETSDIVAAWADRPFAGQMGGVQGQALDPDTGAPLPNILVSAGGLQSFTDSAGRFNLQGLPVGVHTVVGYAMDGMYTTFQQGASVAEGLNTPVDVRMKPVPLANVTFTVRVPNNTVDGAPLRLAGNLFQLGNSFADLKGGLSSVADRMPVMLKTGERTYSLTLQLPVGADLRYKYTLGDGFWNAEHKANGEYQVRQIIVPAGGISLEDYVESWQAGPSAPILFEVTVPPSTPAGDIIYIQFNPYGWTEPLPMWPLGNNQWVFKLFSPLNILGNFGYRYCRNGQCGSADDVATQGASSPGRQVATALFEQDIQDNVTAWAWLTTSGPTTLVSTPVTARAGTFWAGVEMQPYFQPNWSSYTALALQNVQGIGANWVIITPSWTYQRAQPLVFNPIPAVDPLWVETTAMVGQARALNLNTAVFPQAHFPSDAAEWWKSAPRDPAWWNLWFDYYRAFAVNYADLAAQTNAQALILGGDWLGPALPNGTLADGTGSGVPSDAEARWQAVLTEVRAHFRGQVLWALPYSATNLQTPAFLGSTDGVYLLISGGLSESQNPTKEALAAAAASLLDNGVAPLQSLVTKPVYLAFGYPSISGAGANCLPIGNNCPQWPALDQPNPDRPGAGLNLQLQADIYEALMNAVNARPWVYGVISRGYYPPAILQDKSASIHGKPAADVLWYWYQRFLGIVK